MEIKVRVLKYGFIVVFMTMLILPLIFVDLSSDRVSTQENRMLAEHPKLTDLKHYQGQFIRDFDAWFKDSTGFREQFLTLYNVVGKNKWLNSILYLDGQYVYLIGEKGHYFFGDVDGRLIPKFQGKQFLSDEQLSGMADKLEMVNTYLNNKGIPLVVMFCADKESVYPEYYPKSIKRGSEPIQLDIITNYIQENTGVDIFNIKQALIAEKKNYLLYHKIDTMSFTGAFAHYNEIGAFFAYRELIKYINRHFSQITPYKPDDIEIIYDEKEIPNVTLKSGFTYQEFDSSFFDEVDVYRPFTWENHAYKNLNSNLPVILFLCDSYASEGRIGKYFAQQFGKAIFIHFFNIRNIQKYIDQFKPDIVIIESAERQLDGFANCVIEIPELLASGGDS
jgi:hypothetical protein